MKSSVLRSIGYDADTETMEAEFSSGIIYQYFDVPVKTFNEICEAESIGKAFNALRGAFAFRALTLDEQEEQGDSFTIDDVDDNEEPRTAD